MLNAKVEADEDQARVLTQVLVRSGFRETCSGLPPVDVAGPLLEAALAKGISFEHRLSTGKKKVAEVM